MNDKIVNVEDMPTHSVWDDCNIALMLSHDAGLAIAEFFSNRKFENVVAVYFEEESDYSEKVCRVLGVDAERVFYGKKISSSSEHIDWIKKQDVDFVITVYWPWLLGNEYLAAVKDSVNFHPALLPVNRGWYPHVHSLIDGSPAGVTLHKISEGADEGDVWIQKEVKIALNESAKDIYLRLQSEIVSLFVGNWEKISLGQILPVKQDESSAIYHAKNELSSLDKVEFDGLSAKKLFNLLRARSFGHKGFAYFEIDGNKHYLNLRISETSDFSDPL